MTRLSRFEKDYKDAQEGNGIEVLTKRKKELEDLDRELRRTTNTFRAKCLVQEIQKKRREYQEIDSLF